MLLTQQQMLEQWMARRLLLPMRNDAGIEREYGIDIEAMCRRQMRGWYLGLLASAPVEMLIAEEIAGELQLTVDDNAVGHVTLPDNIVRVLTVQCDTWEAPAILTTPDTNLALMQRSYYSRGGAMTPVAIHDGNMLRLYSFDDQPDNPHLSLLRVIRAPADGSYLLTERALSTITPDPNMLSTV